MTIITDGPATAVGEQALLQQWAIIDSGFHHLNRLLSEQVQERTGLSFSSFKALCLLLESPHHAATMSQLARSLDVTTAAVTKITDRLTDAGFLLRAPCQLDRRVIRAVLTEEGIAAGEQARAALLDALRTLVITETGEQDFARMASTLGQFTVAAALPPAESWPRPMQAT